MESMWKMVLFWRMKFKFFSCVPATYHIPMGTISAEYLPTRSPGPGGDAALGSSLP